METLRILRRDIGSQFRESRNIDESTTAKVCRVFWAAVYLGKGIAVGLRGMRTEQLGSAVIYQGRRCFVSNWAGGESPTLSDGQGFYEQYCDRKQITNVLSVREFCHRFNVAFGWYMSSWHSIDVNKRVHPGAFSSR